MVKPDGSTNQTFEHGLGVKPLVVLQRRYDANEDWYWYTSQVDGSHDFVILNSSNAKGDTGTPAPTSSVATLMNAAGNYLVYCWAPIKGFSAMGSYKGTGTTTGAFVHTGFAPKYLVIKNAGSGGDWQQYDAAREKRNPRGTFIELNDYDDENNDGYSYVDFLSNGFKVRGDGNDINLTNDAHLYLAFAEHPFKTARAR